MQERNWAYLKRATKEQKQAMAEIAQDLTKSHQKYGWETQSENWVYTVERSSPNKGKFGEYTLVIREHGKILEIGAFVICKECGNIRELFDGQIPFCNDCWAEFEGLS